VIAKHVELVELFNEFRKEDELNLACISQSEEFRNVVKTWRMGENPDVMWHYPP
jgi:hypothetical protein